MRDAHNTKCILRMLLWAADEIEEQLHDGTSACRLLQLVHELADKHGIGFDELVAEPREETRN